MKKIKVVDWIDYNSGKEVSVGGMGGWVNAHLVYPGQTGDVHLWEDYVEVFEEDERPYLIALREAIKSEDMQITGEQHQNRFVPLFSDDTVGEFSYRGWGDLMAAIYSTEETPISYMDYYM